LTPTGRTGCRSWAVCDARGAVEVCQAERADAVLTPYMKIPNAVLAIDSSQILVLRDYAENVKRMLEMVERVDVAVPSEFVSEVIPIKYAKASDLQAALNSLGSGGGGVGRRWEGRGYGCADHTDQWGGADRGDGGMPGQTMRG